MKRKIGIALLLVFVLAFSLLAFTSCGDGGAQVPVYQGMTITKANKKTLGLTSESCNLGGNMLMSANGNNGNHNGHYKGDHADRDDFINEENPFPDNITNETIEEEIKSSLNVVGSPDTIYYAEPYQDIYINIHIDNPDRFEILSFTLNGKKYSSYMFEEGSDMETIVLKYNVGSASGIVEYTIDAIKYVDGTEIKDVLIAGNKTVMAGIKTQNQLVTSVSGVDIDTNALSFDVNVKDNNNLIALCGGALKAVVYDGSAIVAEKDLSLGENSVVFNNLKTNTLYQYAVVGYYDDLSGDGFKMNVLYKDAFYTEAIVLFDNIVVGQEDVNFSFLWHEDYAGESITAIKLYKGEDLVASLDAGATSATNLLSNNTYKLVAEYENLGKTEVVNIEFTTLAKAVPGILLVNPTSTKTSIGFTVDETDADNVGAITKIELVHKDGTVVADSIEQRAFTNLLSNNSYTVKVTYVYNLNDGLGDKTTTQALKVSTASKRIPTFSSITNKKVGLSSFSADYELNDVDNTLTYYKVELYEGSTLVTENPDKKISFTELSYYTDYTVKITYGYDLNDGKGELTKSRDYSFKTQPYINVTEFKILNSTAVSVGDTILISAKLDNPFGLTVKSVEINGKKYDVTGASTTNRIYVEIVHNGQFAGGDTYFSIENLNATLDSAWFTVAPESRLSDNVFINGKLEIVKMELVNEKLEPVEWTFPSDKVYVLITLDNPTGYTLYALDCINAVTEVKKIDDNRWCCQVELDDGWNEVHLNWIGYRNEYIENGALDCSGLNDYCYKVTSDEIKYVTTPDDLKNMNGGCYYELVGDIDLSGLEWVGNDFNGVFNGKGYAIKNMSFVGTFKNEEARLGLFSAGSGFIQNLNVEKASIIAEITSDNVNGYYAYCGGLVASAIQLNIYNCNIDEYSVFTVKNTTNQDTYVGGLIGYVENNTTVNIQSSVNSADISADNYVGGFVGYVEFDTIVTITNCENRGSVVGSYCAGGFVGYASTVSIADCTNSGDVSAEGEMTTYAGGFVGCASALSIADCTNSGVIGAVSEYSSYAGGFVGYTSTVTIANCTNSGDVSACGGGTAYAGGFVGSASSDYAAFTIENCTNSGDVSAEGEMTAYAGGFVGSAEDVSIENCTNSGDVSTAGEKNIIAGGFVGSAADVSIADCTNRGNIMAQSKSEFESMDTLSLGGFVGIARHLRVSWCINRGNVSADVGRRSSALGGFVGDVTHDSQIDGCVNYGSLSGGYYVGGFVGRIRGGYNSSVKMSYCLNSVNLGSDFVFGGLIGKNDTSNLDVENSYSLANGRGYNGELCTIEQLNSKEFYTDRLCWSVEDWDFSDLDVENGKYPKQK